MLPYVNDSKALEPEEQYDYENAKAIKWYHYVLLNRPLKVVIAFLLLAILAPILVYYFVLFPSLDLPPSDGFSLGTCFLSRNARLPCGIAAVNDTDCHPQCCYDYNSNLCFHRLPSRFSYHMAEEWDEERDDEATFIPRMTFVPYRNQTSVPTIKVSVDEVSSTHLSLTFYNPQRRTIEGKRIEDKDYIYSITLPKVNGNAHQLNILVNRTENETLFSMVRGPFIASDNIWEIAFRLTDEKMFGLGEIPLEQNMTKVIYRFNGSLSSIPLIFAKSNGAYHGLLIDVKEPTEVQIQGENQIVVRSLTVQGLKFHVFVGPEPKDIMRDVMRLIQYNKGLEYWMLGAHVCSDIFVSPTEALNGLSEFLTSAERDKLPFESHCGAMPLVFQDDFCETEGNEYVEKSATLVHNAGKKFIPHVSPYIQVHYEEECSDSIEESTTTEKSWEETIEENSRETKSEETIESITEETSSEHTIESNTESGETTEPTATPEARPECSLLKDFEDLMLRDPLTAVIYRGRIGDEYVIYPDYGNVNDKFLERLWKINAKLDGVILENSWPLDESYKFNNYTYKILPYYNMHFETAFNYTPQWNISRPSGEKYMYSHNEYGNNFANAFKQIVNDIPIWTTSQWMNGEVIVNQQSVDVSWTNLQKELIDAALGGISGNWLWSSPVCGDTEHFNDATQVGLCVKWYMAATYMPMLKIHSKSVSRDPLAFNGTNRIHMITALNRRLSLLPYFYTTLQNGPLLRPMFYQFPHAEELLDLKTQFSVGEDLVIIPNLQPSQSHVHAWIPPPYTWYEFWSGLPLEGEEGAPVTMTTTESDFLTLIRGGSIVVMQMDVKPTAEETRLQSDFTLTIALECIDTEIENEYFELVNITDCSAYGSVYMTESMTLFFEADAEKLKITANGTDFESFCGQEQHDSPVKDNQIIKEDKIWANRVKEINIFGMDDEHNNYDNHRHIEKTIDLCELENRSEIEFSLVN